MGKVNYFEEIGAEISKYAVKNQKSPEAFQLNQNTYNDLYDFAMKDVEGVEIDKTKDRPMDKNAQIFGIHIVINNRMKDGNWRLI